MYQNMNKGKKLIGNSQLTAYIVLTERHEITYIPNLND